MKTRLLILVIALAACAFFSCKKESASDILTGKWKIDRDSTRYAGAFITISNYHGQAGDYFDFRNNDTLYIKEGEVRDTFSYSIISRDNIVIDRFGRTINGVSQPLDVVNLSWHSVTIHVPDGANPGINYERFVYLYR